MAGRTGRDGDPPAATRRARPLVILAALGLVGLVAWLAWSGGHGRRSPPPAKTPPGLVVFLGDSITSGHGLPLDQTFPHLVGTALGVPVLNAGISGDRTEGGRQRLEADVLTHRPRLVVVELGVNDVFGGVPRERTVENLRAITQRIRATGAGVVLIHIRLPGIPGDGYRQEVRAIARSEGALLVEDFLDDVVPRLSGDGLHPTAEGHARLAERLAPVLGKLVSRR